MLITILAAVVAPALVVVVQPDDLAPVLTSLTSRQDVKVTLRIEPTGSLSCKVIDPTALANLRRRSCELVARRWPFAPNRDSAGALQPTDVVLIVRWARPAASDQDSLDGATPLSPDRWVGEGDYPLEAMRQEHQGRVGVSFDITPGGKPVDCKVAEPLKHKELNGAACGLMIRHALFLPAVDLAGMPRTAHARAYIRFILPR